MRRQKGYHFNSVTPAILIFVCVVAYSDRYAICCQAKILKFKDRQGEDRLNKKLKSMHPRKLVFTSSIESTKGRLVLTGRLYNAKLNQ